VEGPRGVLARSVEAMTIFGLSRSEAALARGWAMADTWSAPRSWAGGDRR